GFGCSLEEISPRLAKEVREAARVQPTSAHQGPDRQAESAEPWPFSSITESEFAALPEASRNKLDGALALAMAQLRLESKRTPAAPAPRGAIAAEDVGMPFPMTPMATPMPVHEETTTYHEPAISTARDVVANVSAGRHAAN